MGNYIRLLAVLGLCGALACAAEPEQPGSACALCAPNGILSCAGPGEDPCPGGGDTALPVCGVLAGYSVAATDCGGASINGLRCATGCAWEIGPDASAEIDDAGTISIAPGCTLPVQGEPGVCVVNCSDCR